MRESGLEAVNQERIRSRIDILATILSAALNDKLKTRIMFKASLNYNQAEKYFNFLIKAGLLRKDGSGRRIFYRTTAKGKKFIEKYKALKELIED